MRAGRRDANEAEFVQLWKGLGYTWIPMKPGQGFDGLLITRLDIHVVEVKNPAKKWKLTGCESKTKESIERLGQSYDIVETMQDAEYLAGVI